jgi:HlyD family secretion protein
VILGAVVGISGCSPKEREALQGYAEGEFVYVASPLAGALESLAVQRGDKVRAGDTIFVLESGAEQAARDLAERRLAEGHANLEDTKKGQRAPEIESIEARLKQTRAALVLSEAEFARQTELRRIGAASAQELDRTRATRDQDQQRVLQLEADLKTAQLGARTDRVVAAEANVRALEAALAKADWELAQKKQKAPESGTVFDTFYRQGEWVAAGRPVVALLPPKNIKVRAFVPERHIGTVHPGDPVRVLVDGVREPFAGKVSFVSPRAEFTPPVIYSEENRSKLVFMIEIVFDPAVAARLNPGQPVDVEIGR